MKQAENVTLNVEEWEKQLDKKNRRPYIKERRLLYQVLLGRMAEANAIAVYNGFMPLPALSFWASEHPYGNADIATSIASVLGWGTTALQQAGIPEFVEREALFLHEQVGELLKRSFVPYE